MIFILSTTLFSRPLFCNYAFFNRKNGNAMQYNNIRGGVIRIVINEFRFNNKYNLKTLTVLKNVFVNEK